MVCFFSVSGMCNSDTMHVLLVISDTAFLSAYIADNRDMPVAAIAGDER